MATLQGLINPKHKKELRTEMYSEEGREEKRKKCGKRRRKRKSNDIEKRDQE